LSDTLVFILVVVITLFIRLFLRDKINRKIRYWIQSLKLSPVKKLERQRRYADVAALYRRRARLQRISYNRENLLAIAALYEHDPDTAIPLFQRALNGAVGHSVLVIQHNLAIALLQKRMYREAVELMDELRTAGSVPVIPYILGLVITDEVERARDFYAHHPIKDKDERVGVEAVLGCWPKRPETLEPVRKLIAENSMWLYQPLLKDLLMKREVEVFFAREDRYTVLAQQAQHIVDALETQPTLFSDPHVRWLRRLMSAIIPRIQSQKGCSSLFGLVHEVDEHLPDALADTLKAECRLFFNRLYYIFRHTYDLSLYDAKAERAFIQDQLPPGATRVLHGAIPRCEVYIAPGLNIAFSEVRITVSHGEFSILEVTSEEGKNWLISQFDPLQELITTNSQVAECLEPIVYGVVCHGEPITKETIRKTAALLPEDVRPNLLALTSRYPSDDMDNDGYDHLEVFDGKLPLSL
jgi:hypothetical protein